MMDLHQNWTYSFGCNENEIDRINAGLKEGMKWVANLTVLRFQGDSTYQCRTQEAPHSQNRLFLLRRANSSSRGSLLKGVRDPSEADIVVITHSTPRIRPFLDTVPNAALYSHVSSTSRSIIFLFG
jgi:hypothetical protein